MPWATKITEYVNAHGTVPVTCWAGTFGYPIGTVAWSAMVESQAQLVAGTTQLLADDGYLDLLEEAADLITTPGEDTLRELIYGTPGDPPPIGSVAAITTAVAMVDRLADAIGWAVEIGQFVESTVDAPIIVLTDVFGAMGGITWILAQPDFVASDGGRAKLVGNADYLKQISGSKDLFIPGSGHIGQATRIA
ncbi:MAG: hypothetical protein QOJ08_1477 [Ilumatobacteraceae bacterium]|jgi:hypothetical protein